MFGFLRGNSGNNQIPFHTFTGWLKCHRPDPSDLDGRFLMNEVFVTFLGSDRVAPLDPIQTQVKEIAEERGFRILDTSSNKPRRRFAGDWAGLKLLDRGCYYSVCRREGDDGGTLANELNAYLRPDRTGLAIALHYPDNSEVKTFMTDVGEFPARPIQSLRNQRLLSENDTSANMSLRTTTKEMRFERVFDLRYPETRDWLFSKFGNGDDDWITYRGPRVADKLGYWAILPTIMDLKAGGNDATDQIAVYLRNNGAQGMIFPSARSDTMVRFVEGRLEDFSGWNFVDWSGAEPPPKRQLNWLTSWIPPDGTTQIRVADNREFKGSYSVHGNKSHHMWLLHMFLLFGIASQMRREELEIDTGYVVAYRWHTGRIVGSQYMAKCLSCSDHTEFPIARMSGEQRLGMHHSCPRCGYSEVRFVQ